MCEVLKVKIIPTRKKNTFGNNRKQYFNKLSKNGIIPLLNLFTEDEQIKLFTLDSKFKFAFLDLCQIETRNHINEIKYMLSLNKLKKESKGFSSYLNILLNINIINLNPECLGIKLDEKKKLNRLKLYIEKTYKETNLDKLLIQINEKNDFNTYYSLLNIIDKEIREKLKYDIDICKSIEINQNKDEIIKLFNLISFKNIKPFQNRSKTKLIEIQNYYIENNIKSIHKFIWSQKQSSINNAKNYFTTNKNCLLGINNKICLPLCEDNKESIDTINIESFPISQFDYPDIKLKKIKFSFASDEFNPVLLNNINFENLEEISGLVITKKNINDYIQKINGMKNLKKIIRIEFGEEDEDGNKEDENKLFQDFFNGIKNKHSENLVEITTWFYIFKKGRDYEFILNNFPNIRKIQEDYDTSGLYDQRIEIKRIFSCNAEQPLKENDIKAITKMVNNFIKQKKEGDNSIKFDLYNNFKRLAQLFEYWVNNKEKDILAKINYINFVIEAELTGNELIPLNKINVINYINENICLSKLLKDIKIVNQIVIKGNNCLEKNINFFDNKNIISIVWDNKDLTKNEFESLVKIKTLKYLILDDNAFKANDYLLKNKFHFKIIAKNYYIDTTEISQ